MKHVEIKDLLKKDLLILELPRKADVEIFPNSIEIYNQFTGQEETIKGSYTLLGKPDEIREEDASEIVEKVFTFYKDYNKTNRQFNFAAGSLRSAIEAAGVLWENPYSGILALEFPSAFEKTELRTFDRSRTLIFVKN